MLQVNAGSVKDLATPCWQDPTRSKQLSTVAILGFQFGLYHVVAPLRFLRSISLVSLFAIFSVHHDNGTDCSVSFQVRTSYFPKDRIYSHKKVYVAWQGKFVSQDGFHVAWEGKFGSPERTSLCCPKRLPFRREFMLPVKASLLVPRREFIVSRRKKLVPKMELDDSDNRSLVATSGTCSISDCLAAEITRPPVRQNLGDSHSAMFLKSKLCLNFQHPWNNTLRENTGHNTWMLCLIIRRK